MRMRPGSWPAVLGVLLAVTSSGARADETSTLKGDDSAFADLTQRATSGSLDLGARSSGAAPEYVETEVVVLAPLSSSVVHQVVAQGLPEISYCYEKAMARVKDASGEVSLSFVVQPRGNVTAIKIEVVGPRGKGLERCMAQRVKKWHFPANDVQTEVAIPLVFDLGGQAVR